MRLKRFLSICLLVSLVSCSGGGGESPPAVDTAATSSALAQICAANNPYATDATSPTQVGVLDDEKKWLKAYLNERYLWYRNMASVDGTASVYNQSSVASSLYYYFYALLNPNKTASGRYVDEFSFMTSTYAWNNQITGQDLDYGWMLSQTGTGSSRRIYVSYVYPSSTSGLAQSGGVLRGDEIISIDGILATDTIRATEFNQYLNPSTSGTHAFILMRSGISMTVNLTAMSTSLPQAESRVVLDSQGVRWGYLLFNSHSQGVETYLVQAIADFKAQNISELVIDLRYNGGGYLNIANGLAYAVAGPQRAQGKVFETTKFNDKRSDENSDLLFRNRTLFGNQTYSTLGLSKIYVLTSNDTCSASESIINGLRGIDVTVELIGDTTCGKPYGFYAQDNCGLTYAAMEFEGVNAKGQGGYSEGMAVSCYVQDDLSHPLGDTSEALFAQAIARQRGQACSVPVSALALGARAKLKGSSQSNTPQLIRDNWKKNKYLSSEP
jgi:carboxyl-terminal processing protease